MKFKKPITVIFVLLVFLVLAVGYISFINSVEPNKVIPSKGHSNLYPLFNSLERPLVGPTIFDECKNINAEKYQINEDEVEIQKTCLSLKRLGKVKLGLCDGVDLSGPPLENHNDVRFLIPNCLATDAHVRYLEKRLSEMCVDAKEKIYESVSGIKGFYISIGDKEMAGVLHSHEWRYDWLLKGYSYVEYPSLHETGKINKQYLILKQPSKLLDKPTSLYSVEISPLLSKQENRQGLYGSKLIIGNLQTNKVLAERIIYYFVVKNHLRRENGKKLYLPRAIPDGPHYVATCRNLPLEADKSYNDHVPRDSYDFIRQVLRP